MIFFRKWKISPKIEILAKAQKFGQQSKIWSTIKNLVNNQKI